MGVCGGKRFNADTDIPDLSGKVIFVTGGSSSPYLKSPMAITDIHTRKCRSRQGHIYLGGRDPTKGDAAINEIKAAVPNVAITFVECDLASLASVEKAAKQLTSESQRLDIPMCNAGIMGLPAGLTEDGYELQFGTNQVGHALLIKLLLPTLLRTAEEPNTDVQIISLTSSGFCITPTGGIVFKDLRTLQGSTWSRYGQSKLANVIYTAELARRYPSITTVSVHPGVVDTGLISGLMQNNVLLRGANSLLRATVLQTPAEGASNQLWAATGREEVVGGKYYELVGVLGKHSKDSKSEKLREELWEWTQKELERYEV